MSDEPEMNPELESFAASLRSVGAPEAKIDREQLMYDAGWAAAMEQRQPTAAVSRKNGVPTMVLSFISGIAVAAAVFLSVVPLATDGPLEESIKMAVVKTEPATPTQIASRPANVTDGADNQPSNDFMDWIDNLPPGHSVAAGFSSRPVSPNLAPTKVSYTRPANQSRRQPTTHLLMQELAPSTRQRKVMPHWTAWLTPGT